MTDSDDRDMTPPGLVSRLRRWFRVIGLVLSVIAAAVLAVLMALSRPATEHRPVRLLPPSMSHTESVHGQAVLGTPP